jgi:hypothetical protein
LLSQHSKKTGPVYPGLLKGDNMKKIKTFSDPGHSWAKVKRSELKELGIFYNISKYSYQRGHYVYLEEDSDLPRYLDALMVQKIEYTIESSYTNNRSKIRSYAPFQYTASESLDAKRLKNAKSLLFSLERFGEFNTENLENLTDILKDYTKLKGYQL